MNQGWIGAVFGFTVWIVVAAFLFVARDWKLGVLLFVLAGVQVFGAVLIDRTRGIQHALNRLIVLGAAVGLAVLLAVDVAGRMATLQQANSLQLSPYWFLLMYPLLGVVVRLIRKA